METLVLPDERSIGRKYKPWLRANTAPAREALCPGIWADLEEHFYLRTVLKYTL